MSHTKRYGISDRINNNNNNNNLGNYIKPRFFEINIYIFNLRAFGSSFLGLPVVVARAHLLVANDARRNTFAFGTALLAEEHARLLVRCRRATVLTSRCAR